MNEKHTFASSFRLISFFVIAEFFMRYAVLSYFKRTMHT